MTIRVQDATSPMWLGTGLLRVVTYPFAIAAVAVNYDTYARPWLGVTVLVFMGLWTLVTLAYSFRPALRRGWLVIADLLVTSGLMLTTLAIFDLSIPEHVPSVITTVWGSVPAVAMGVYGGWLIGASGGLLLAVCTGLARLTIDMSLFTDAVLLIGSGLVIGMASTAARRSMVTMQRALRTEAATAERERLASSIHDSVLQVLAHVRRRGGELGGEAAELGRLAGEQEVALRSLVASGPVSSAGESGEVDLLGLVRPLGTSRISISAPAGPILLPHDTANELTSAIREALVNAERHAGPSAQVWVLIEDLGTEVVISVRDDGAGIPQGRLEAAAEEGRLGVASSITAKIRALGGTASLETAPEEGTEWELHVPRVRPEPSTGLARLVKRRQHG
ncbi:MacS family sensor histidine kinase [Sciscionella marina]|uniref:MacS family sensor histidine kinase n=1 Tax=Sciscionella marina TaxID=508770 RepID=UPI000372DE5B|nr:DUF5931 domain-containing protein [Sciscionella marina]